MSYEKENEFEPKLVCNKGNMILNEFIIPDTQQKAYNLKFDFKKLNPSKVNIKALLSPAIYQLIEQVTPDLVEKIYILNTLNDDGTFMLVEPFANDELKDNLNSQSGLYYSFSTLICVPTSRAQEVGLQLGAQAGEKRLCSVLNEAGFNNIERRCFNRCCCIS